ncbi:MAG: Crp/Fnr family transcriptional regulator [Nitrospiraceae bacterium]
MSGKDSPRSADKNRILAAFSAGNGKHIIQKLQPIVLVDKQVLYEQGDSIKYVYFPVSAVVSLVSAMEDGFSIEVATTGHEGFVGIGVYLGIGKAFTKAIVQAPGEAFRIQADLFMAELEKTGSFHALLHRYTHALLMQISRSGGCNSLHSVEQRCARWLLAMHDRSKTDELPLTQEFLGEMLGVRRPSVSVVAAKLQKAGLIRYNRGKVKICDRPGLEKASCECYRILKEEYDSLLD